MRKIALVLGGLLGVVLAFAGWAWQRVGRIDVERVAPDLYILSGVGGNVGVLVTDGGVVVVDTMTFVRQGAAILARIRQLTDQPVAAILNTHYNLDHTHGNPAFAPGTRVIATSATLRHLQELDAKFWRDPPARDLLPNATFDDAQELTVGGKTIRAYWRGRGHTDGDLVVQYVDDRVLQTGDLFSNGHWPNIDLEAGGSVAEWAPTMERVLALDFDRVIPGHGPVSNRAGFRQFQAFMASLWQQTSAIADAGGTLEEALVKVDLDRFALGRLWFAPQLTRSFVVKRAWQEARALHRPVDRSGDGR